MEKHKFATISLSVRDRAISSKFSTHRVSEKCTLGNFQKNFPLPTYGGHFEFLSKMGKKQIYFYLLYPFEVERFRRNFRPTGYLSNVPLAIFKKFSSSQKWQPFLIFAKNGKTQICFCFLNRAR